MEVDVLFKYLQNILDFKISFVIFANGRNFGPFLLSKKKFTERLEYGCVLYNFEACDTEISNMHLLEKYLNFAICAPFYDFCEKIVQKVAKYLKLTNNIPEIPSRSAA